MVLNALEDKFKHTEAPDSCQYFFSIAFMALLNMFLFALQFIAGLAN